MLRLVTTLTLAAGAAGYSVGRPPTAVARRRPSVSAVSGFSLSSASMPAPGGQPRRNQNYYRVLGITEDASYDEITEAFSSLVAQADGDDTRIQQLERARDRILDERLKQRLSGATPAVKDPLVKPKEKRDWLAPLKAFGKYVEVPDVPHLVKMSCIFLGFACASLVAPGVSDQMSFFSFIFAPAFIYQRGMPDPVRDDFGQVGEILPTKPVPAVLAGLIVALFGGAGYLLAVFYLSILIPPSVVPIQALCNSCVALFIWFATLFFKTQVE
mmetsp:Transcript_6607/g.16919  ORF Transcript_6607/g.16919 Transcript_6607/m.16919 type:complete len:271 (+) Transcript_6607:10-822(+)